MKIIWTFTLLMIPGVVRSMSVTGYSGGGVMIRCRYDQRYRDNAKYFCRKNNPDTQGQCSDLIKTEIKDKWVDSGRFSLYDDTSSSILTVIIRDLTEGDSDTYYCATDIYAKIDLYTEVSLKVLSDQQIRTVTGYSGGNVTLTFKCGMKHKNRLKICKTIQCFTVKNTERTAEWEHDSRFSVHDDRSAGLLRLIIRELKQNDSGKYRIIVEVSADYSFFSKFNIRVETTSSSSPSSSSSPLPASSSSTSSLSPPSLPASSSTSSLPSSSSPSSSSSASSFSSVRSSLFSGVSTSSSSLASSSSGSSLIVPLVLVLVLVVLVIVAGLLLKVLCKKHQSQDSDSSSQTGAGKEEVVSHTGCDYEEIKDSHRQLPTNPSDSSADFLYATAQLPTNPSDSSADFLYATAQLPTNPSDSSATVEKASAGSQSCITSAEDLNYAVVNFHTKSDCPDSVSFRKNQDYSEYAAVNHLIS